MRERLTWVQAVAECERSGRPYVLVTVLGVTGSVPREPASKMVVTPEHSYDTIGGGHLEYRVIARARERLANHEYSFELAHFPLGASLGQCCGGSVAVLLETQTAGNAPSERVVADLIGAAGGITATGDSATVSAAQ